MNFEPGRVLESQADYTEQSAISPFSSAETSLPATQKPDRSASEPVSPPLSFEQLKSDSHGHPTSLALEESLDQPMEDSPMTSSSAESQQPHSATTPESVASKAVSVYKPHLKALVVAGVTGLLLISGGGWALWQTLHHAPETPRTAASAVSLPPASEQELTINSKLAVAQDAVLRQDLTVNGLTTLQGVVVNTDALVNGSLRVQGNGSFSGSISAANFNSSSLTVVGNSNFSGNITVNNMNASGNLTVGGTVIAGNLQGKVTGSFTGSAEGTFSGDGSKLNGISASSCADCVRLQSQTVAAQAGNVSILGNVTIAGNLSLDGGMAQLGNTTQNGTATLTGNSTQTGNNSIAGNVTVSGTSSFGGPVNISGDQTLVGNFLLTGNATQLGNVSLTGNTVQTGNVSLTGNQSVTGNTSISGSVNVAGSFSLTGDSSQLGNATIAGSLVGRGIHVIPAVDSTEALLVQDANGGNLLNVDTVHHQIIVDNLLPNAPGSVSIGSYTPAHVAVAGWNRLGINGVNSSGSDSSRWSQTGKDGLARIVFGADDGLHYVRCLDTICSRHNDTVVDSSLTGSAGAFYTLAIGSDGFARIAFNDYRTNDQIGFIRCLNADCSATTSQEFNDGGSSYGVSISLKADDSPYIVYNDYNTGIHVLTCSDINCTGSSDTLIQDDQGNDDIPVSALGSDGKLQIAYVFWGDNTNPYAARYVRCTNNDCSTHTVRDIAAEPDYYLSLAVGTDNVAKLSYNYWNTTDSQYELRYLNCQTTDCSTPSLQTVGVDTDGYLGTNSLVLDGGGVPHFTYQYQNSTDFLTAIKYASCSDALCSTYTTSTVESSMSWPTSLSLDATDKPLIAYMDNSNYVRFASLNTSDGEDIIAPAVTTVGQLNPGTSIGSASAPFGQIYTQGLNVQTTGSDAALVVNQVGIITDTSNHLPVAQGPLADFQINGNTVAAIDVQGSMTLGALESNTYMRRDYALNGAMPLPVRTADLNNDGRLDLVTASSVYSPGVAGMTVYMNNGSSFIPHTYLNSGYNKDVQLADLNGDGYPDIVTAASPFSFFYVALNNGDGTFGTTATYATTSSASRLITTDLNNDGKLDVVVSDSGNGTLSLFINKGDGTFNTATTITLTSTSYGYNAYGLEALTSGDFNGDGRIDIAASTTANIAYGGTYIIMQNSDGSFSSQEADTYIPASDLQANDLNGDGKLDIVFASASGVAVAYGDGAGLFNFAGAQYLTADAANRISVRDLNSDGKLDIAATSAGSSILTLFMGNGSGTFARKDIPLGSVGTGVAPGDYNGDGQMDFALADTTHSMISVYSAPSLVHPSLVVAPADGRQGLVLQANTGQNADLLDVVDSTGNTAVSVSATGALTTDTLAVTKDASVGNNLTVTNTLKVGNLNNVYGHDFDLADNPYTPATLDTNATTLSLADDSASNLITLPFTVNYFGQSYSGLYIGSDGYLNFKDTGIKSCRTDISVSKQSCPGSIWGAATDLNLSAGGTIKYETIGTAPNRTFVVEFNNIAEFGSTGHATFQIQVLENDGSQQANIIKIETSSVSFNAHTFAQGLVSSDGTRAVYDPSHNNISTLGAEGMTYTYTPQLLAYNETNSFAVEKQIFAGGDVQVQGAVTSSRLNTNIISAQPTIQLTSGSNTPGLNVSWYNANSSNFSTIGAGALAYQGVDTSLLPFYANCSAGFCQSPNWPTGVNTTYVNARWTGWIKADYTGNYTFSVTPDNHAALYVNNSLVVNNLSGPSGQQKNGSIYLTGNAWYPIEYDYNHGSGSASSYVNWSNNIMALSYIPLDHVSATLPGGYVGSQGVLQLQSATSVTNQASSSVGLLVKGAAGQSADLLQLQTSGGATVAKVDANGALTLAPTYQPTDVNGNGTDATNVLTVTGSKGGNSLGTTGQKGGTGSGITITGGAGGNAPAGSTNGTGGSVAIQGGAAGNGPGAAGNYGNILLQTLGNGNVAIGNNSPSAKLHITIDSAAKTGQIIRGASSQSADLLQLQDSNGAVESRFDANGNMAGNGVNLTVGNLAVPVFSGNTGATTGGTLTSPNTYFYAIVATNAQGQTVASASTSFTPTTTTSTYTLRWSAIAGATGYKIYRNTANSFTSGSLLLTTIANGTTTSFVDTGSATTAGLPPTAPTGTGLTFKAWQSQSGALLQALDSTGAVLASISATGNLTVKAATFNGTLSVNGHIISGNTSGTATAAVQAAAGTTATCTLSGNDTAGVITITVNGTGIATGSQCIITFGSSFGAVPRSVISPVDANSQARGVYLGATTTNMTVGFTAAGVAGTAYSYNYFNIQ